MYLLFGDVANVTAILLLCLTSSTFLIVMVGRSNLFESVPLELMLHNNARALTPIMLTDKMHHRSRLLFKSLDKRP